MTKCYCGALAEYQDPINPYSQLSCPSCFTTYIEKKVLKGVPRRARGRPIAVALSGGKDSSMLLEVLYAHKDDLKLPSLIALVLEEEIPEIQKEKQKVIQYLQKKLPELPITTVKYSDLFGHPLPNLISESDNKDCEYTPCSICGIFRKQALFHLGIQFNVDFIALGTTLEDEAATVILNTIRGIPQNKQRYNHNSESYEFRRLPQRIKPLARISEDLIRMYIQIKKIPTITSICPYTERSLRSEITSFFTSLKARDPQCSFLFNILKSKQEFENKTTEVAQLYSCKRCKMLSHQVLCPSCCILAKLFDPE